MRCWLFLIVLSVGLASADFAAAQQRRALGPLFIGMTYQELLVVDANGGRPERARRDPPPYFVFLRPFQLGGVNFFGGVELTDGRATSITMQSSFEANNAAECGTLASAMTELIELSTGPLNDPRPLGGAGVESATISHSILHHQTMPEDRHRWAAYSMRDGFTAVTATFNEPVRVRVSGSSEQRTPPCLVRVALKPPYVVSGTPPGPDAASLASAEALPRARWSTLVDGETALAHFPPLAETFGVEGAVRLECLVVEEQRVQCVATEDEAAAGWGFGAAAVALSQHFRIEQEIDGMPTFGRRVGFNMPFRQP